MVSIQVDEQTARALEVAAAGLGLSLSEYVKTLVDRSSPVRPRESWDSLQRELMELSVDGSLPSNFSRADIYSDHD